MTKLIPRLLKIVTFAIIATTFILIAWLFILVAINTRKHILEEVIQESKITTEIIYLQKSVPTRKIYLGSFGHEHKYDFILDLDKFTQFIKDQVASNCAGDQTQPTNCRTVTACASWFIDYLNTQDGAEANSLSIDFVYRTPECAYDENKTWQQKWFYWQTTEDMAFNNLPNWTLVNVETDKVVTELTLKIDYIEGYDSVVFNYLDGDNLVFDYHSGYPFKVGGATLN